MVTVLVFLVVAVGFTTESLQYNGCKFVLWDLSGSDKNVSCKFFLGHTHIHTSSVSAGPSCSQLFWRIL